MFHPRGPTLRELAAQAFSSIERGYDLLAPKFDHTPFRTPDAVLGVVANELAAAGPIDSALDICCGTGAAMGVLRPLCRRQVVGLDFSRGMLEEARRRTADAPGDAALQFVRADALAMPFVDDFDLAVSFGSHGHVLRGDEGRFVDQVARVLCPGGRFVFVSAPLPPAWSPTYWLARGFNAAMHLRNLLRSPPFIMYYLTFSLPGAAELLERHDFAVERRPGIFPQPFGALELVIATKSAESVRSAPRRGGGIRV